MEFLTRNGGSVAKSFRGAKEFAHAYPGGSQPGLIRLGRDAFQ